MKTKKLIFLIAISICILVTTPIPILRFFQILNKRGSLPPDDAMKYYQAFPTPGSDLRFIEANVEIRIPPSASEIYACIGGFNEKDSRVRFNLPPPDFPLFIRTTFCESPFIPIDPRELHHSEFDPEWWNPDMATNLTECVGGTSYTEQQIMVDRTDNKSMVIYVLTLMEAFEGPTE
ncbi:MAG: hypothetical protein C0410_04140 [Anaerolinea sp.]|nr:hypothetical protein [Anaerolinea sp.]